VQFIKTICVLTVLGALAYGAYTTLTSSPPSDPPADVEQSSSPPDVQLPGLGDSPSLAGSGRVSPPLSPPPSAKYSAGDRSGAATISPPLTGASITNVRPVGAPQVPERYPSTNVPPGPLDAYGAQPMSPAVAVGGATAATAGTSSNVSPTSAVSAGGLSPVPQIVQASPSVTNPSPTMSMPNAVASASAGGVSFPPAVGSTNLAAATPSVAAQPPASTASSSALIPSMEKVQAYLNQSKFAEAHEELSQWFDNSQLSEVEQRRVQETLDQLAGVVVYSRQHLLEPPHTVAQGETLQAVADRYQVPVELLSKINGIADPLYLPAGTQLKVVKGPFDALIDKSRGSLTLFVGDGLYAGSFPIGFGRDLTLPDGNYTVQAKLMNPTFQAADGMIAADDPRNPLGERWLDLGNRQGLHGTNDPAGLASGAARGYLILGPRDSEDVYDILSVGSKVMIRP
jgi:LysM repeat protein